MRYRNGCYVAEMRGRPDITVPEFEVERVVAFGPLHITQPALRHLLKRKAEVHFLTRFGRPLGRLVPADDPRVDVRIAQFRLCCDGPLCRKLATAIVSAKISNCRKLIQRYSRNHPDCDLQDAVAALAACATEALEVESVEELRGVEGAAAARYFQAFALMLNNPCGFDGRSRRPPKDPVNALLSLGYTLLGSEISGLLTARGLDPCLGVYHQPRRGMPALAQDILEEFRAPVVDRHVLALFNLGKLAAEDFTAGPKGGFMLKEASLRTFLREYERNLLEEFKLRNGKLTCYRRLLAAQVAALRRAVDGNADYRPFRMQTG